MPKKKHTLGYLYLLKSDTVLSDENGLYRYYKWGCTRKTPEERCKIINYRAKKYGKFSVIDSFYTKNPFYFERQFLYYSQITSEFIGVYIDDKNHMEILFSNFINEIKNGNIK